jgi:hypothetical protein
MLGDIYMYYEKVTGVLIAIHMKLESTSGISLPGSSSLTIVIENAIDLQDTNVNFQPQQVAPTAIPGFPIESIIAGLAAGIIAVTILKRKQRKNLLPYAKRCSSDQVSMLNSGSDR